MREKVKAMIKSHSYIIKLAFDTSKTMYILYWLIDILIKFIPLINIFIWKFVLDTLTNIYNYGKKDNSIWVLIFLYLSLQVLSSILLIIYNKIFDSFGDKVCYNIDNKIMKKTVDMDTAFFDMPENADKKEAAQDSYQYITTSITWVTDSIISIFTFIASMVAFLVYNWFFGLLFLMTYIPGAYISFKHKQKLDQFSISNIPKFREKEYYKVLLTRKWWAKDLRLYNLAEYFKNKHNGLWKRILSEREKLFKKGIIESFLASLITYIGIIIIIFLSIKSIIEGGMTIGTFCLYIGLAQQVGNDFKQLISNIAVQSNVVVPRVNLFIEYMDQEKCIKDEGKRNVPCLPTIEFCNVCFKYPNGDHDILNHLNFKIESGEKIALVGVNGAGKSTIIKLLLRFYEPDCGEILIEGRNIKEYSIKSLRKTFGVCFQDIMKYALTMRENIAISDISKVDDKEAIWQAASLSGTDQIFKDWEKGMETPMTRSFDNDGQELSGGQWQKVGLSRAFFRNADIIILDEPSAALDPEAEDYIFSSFKKICQNKGGILISHRLSSVIMVDKIILLEDGRAVEVGQHDELMKLDGTYAQLYHLQAEKYIGGTSCIS